MSKSNALIISLFFFLSFCLPLFSQENKLISEDSYQENFIIEEKLLEITIHKKDAQRYKIDLKQIGGDEKNGSIELLSPLGLDVFKLSFKKLFEKLEISIAKERSDSEAQRIFLNHYKWELSDNINDIPLAGQLYIHNPVMEEVYDGNFLHIHKKADRLQHKLENNKNRFINKNNRLDSLEALYSRLVNLEKDTRFMSKVMGNLSVFHADSIDIEVFQGSIRNILVHGELHTPILNRDQKSYLINIFSDTTLQDEDKFELIADTLKKMPVSKTLENFRSTHPIGLSSIKNAENLSKIYLKSMFNTKGKNTIILGDLLSYIPALAYDSDNYGPADGKYTISQLKSKKVINFYKEKTSEILSLKIYGDFIGLDDDQPNGLIQTEITKKFTIISQKSSSFVLRYIEPRLIFSKIDKNNRILLFNDKIPVENLSLLQYANFSTGINFNIFGISSPEAKLEFTIDGGTFLNRTLLKNENSSDGNEFPVNSVLFSINPNIRVRPDTRYGFEFGYNWHIFDTKDKDINNHPSSIHEFKLFGFYTPNKSSNNTLYIKFGVFFNDETFDENFLQLQAGYKINFLNTRRN